MFTYVEFDHDTSETPHIDSHIIGNSQNNFRGSVVSALYISIHPLIFKATAPEINQFDSRLF